MIGYFRRHLVVRIIFSFLLIILLGGLVIAIATRFSLPPAFNRHMGVGMVMRSGMMQPGLQVKRSVVELVQNFQASFNEALLWALLAAGVVAIPVSVLLSQGIVAPVKAMMRASRRIAEGNYSERVQVSSQDELGQLAGSFNQMAEKLEQVEIMRQQLIGDISHELRTPLTAIQGSMEGLMDGVLTGSPDTYQQIHQEAGRLAHLVDDLQELSRVEAGAYKLEMQPVKFIEYIQIAVKRLTAEARKKNIHLLVKLPGDLPLMHADPDRLTQVMTNLVGNAIQYTPAGGQVEISAQAKPGEVVVCVSDTGIGIPAEHLPHLFHRFYRVDKSRSRQAGGGSGIGLTIARHLVEAMGGAIWVESDGEGKGSRFLFSLQSSNIE
jgi:two-component system sensor histidine kinase BaeS